MHVAASVGTIDCLVLLLKHGGSILPNSTPTITPLHLAAANGHKGMLFLLTFKLLYNCMCPYYYVT